MGLLDRTLSGLLPWLPRSLVGRVARRYVAGTTQEDVLKVVETLEARGLAATVDILGENVSSQQEARDVTEAYLELQRGLAERRLGAHVSVKLTHVGLRLSEDLAFENSKRLVARAGKLGSFVRIDMEDSTTTDAALRLFRGLRPSKEPVGLAVQACLRRSAADLESLLPLDPDLRICKGIYREPRELAFQGYQEIRDSFLSLCRRLLEGGGRAAFATHDAWLVRSCLRLVRELGVDPERHEFQMLLGVGHRLRPAIAAAGSRLRIYCPYGSDWYDYSLRRLRENPRIAGFVLRDLFRVSGSRQAEFPPNSGPTSYP